MEPVESHNAELIVEEFKLFFEHFFFRRGQGLVSRPARLSFVTPRCPEHDMMIELFDSHDNVTDEWVLLKERTTYTWDLVELRKLLEKVFSPFSPFHDLGVYKLRVYNFDRCKYQPFTLHQESDLMNKLLRSNRILVYKEHLKQEGMTFESLAITLVASVRAQLFNLHKRIWKVYVELDTDNARVLINESRSATSSHRAIEIKFPQSVRKLLMDRLDIPLAGSGLKNTGVFHKTLQPIFIEQAQKEFPTMFHPECGFQDGDKVKDPLYFSLSWEHAGDENTHSVLNKASQEHLEKHQLRLQTEPGYYGELYPPAKGAGERQFEEEVVKDIVYLHTWSSLHKVKECLYHGTPEEANCGYVNFQLAEFREGVEVQHSAIVITLINLKSPRFLPSFVDNTGLKQKNGDVLAQICYHHAQSDLLKALIYCLGECQKYDSSISHKNLLVNHIGLGKIRSYDDLGLSFMRQSNFDHHEYAEKYAHKKPVVEIATRSLEPGDRRCIRTVEGCYCQGYCNNIEHDFVKGSKEMPLPAYVVRLKKDKTKILGNICYEHATILQSSLRMIADRVGVTMDDLHVDVHWNSGGALPPKYDEEDFLLQHELNPDWKEGKKCLCKKWKILPGNVDTCKFCRKTYFMPSAYVWDKMEEKRKAEGADPEEVYKVFLSCCRSCQDKKVAKGCQFCKRKITRSTIPDEFDWRFETDYTCNRRECWKCMKCKLPFSSFAKYKKLSQEAGLYEVDHKDPIKWGEHKKLYDAYFDRTRDPDFVGSLICRECGEKARKSRQRY